ncbi:hypothetical protein AU186_10275 [Mycobacterium sp. GA-1999]|nr:hypothetical protein AU185_21135 [Mycobacterium sp. GA-0227b]KUH90059.1 hypothetical protein AU186_10275 [Mycobacterium sp. GA-1999]
MAVVVLDLLIAIGDMELYDAVRSNVIDVLRMAPCSTAAKEVEADWRRGGNHVWPQPRVDYGPPGASPPAHHSHLPPVPPKDALLLTAVCRSRHYPQAIIQLLGPEPTKSSPSK